MKMTNYFKEHFLTCGQSRDNFVFHGCPKELIEIAKKSLEKSTDVKACNIAISRKQEEQLENAYIDKNNQYIKAFGKAYFYTLFMKEIIKHQPKQEQYRAILDECEEAFLGKDLEKAKIYLDFAPKFRDILMMARRVGKIELNIFLEDTQNTYIQKAINNFISSKTPFSVKIFNNSNKFCVNYDYSDRFVQPVIDYMDMNIQNYIDNGKGEELESK